MIRCPGIGGFSVDFAGALYEHWTRQKRVFYLVDMIEVVRQIDKNPAAGAVAAEASPLVTIVIVNHNYGEFIEQCIHSVDAQEYALIQCIILDCASDDDSKVIIESAITNARKPCFEFKCLGINRGHLLNAMSIVADIKGAFVTFLDSDDLLFPQFVLTHVDAHLAYGDAAALSVTDQIQVDAKGDVLAGTCHWHQKWRDFGDSVSAVSRGKSEHLRLRYVPADWDGWAMNHWIWGSTSAIMFRREVLEAFAPATTDADDEMFRIVGVDAYLARLAHLSGGTLLIDAAGGAYRRHGKNVWSRNDVLGGQTPSSPIDTAVLYRRALDAGRRTLSQRRADFIRHFGEERYKAAEKRMMSGEVS
jgi:glycosyltransferase involved in cell wall biosynthesis